MPPSMVVCVAEEIRKGNNKMGKCTDCKNLVFSSEYMDEERDIRRGWCCEADHHGEDYHYIVDEENDCKFFEKEIDYREGYADWETSHKLLGIKSGYHFKVRDTECRLRNDGKCVLVYDPYDCVWKLGRKCFKMDYLLEHKDEIEKYPMGKWHIERNEPSDMRKLKKHYRKLKRR